MGNEGCIVTFNHKNWKFSKGSLVIEKCVKVGTLYLSVGHIILSTLIISYKNKFLVTVTTIESEEQTIVVDSKIVLWHNTLGHMSENGMKLLHSKKFLLSLKCFNMDFYEICVYGKKKRVGFVKIGKENKN